MLVLFRIFELITVATLLIMFHIWYLWGVWLSSYITVKEEGSANPHVFSFGREKKWLDPANKDMKK